MCFLAYGQFSPTNGLQLKANLKQLTENVDKCTEVLEVVSPLQQLDLKEIATQGKSQKGMNLIFRLENTTLCIITIN